jgi:hypothetical protein
MKRPEVLTVAVRFPHVSGWWRGELIYADAPDRPPVFTYRMPDDAGEAAQPWMREGCEDTIEVAMFRRCFPRSFDGTTIAARTRRQFERQFLIRVRGCILDSLSGFYVILWPVTHVGELVTPDLIRSLAGRLRAGGGTASVYFDLVAQWPRLRHLTDAELAERFGGTANGIKKRRHRLGLLGRPPGPRP